MLLVNPGMSYRVQLEFAGLRPEDAALDCPTESEFLVGKPYFASDSEFEKAAKFVFYAAHADAPAGQAAAARTR